MLKWVVLWPVATVTMFATLAVVLSLPLATVIGLAFVVEAAVFVAYGMVAGLRYLSRPHAPRQEYRRHWQPEPRLEPGCDAVIRVVGEVVDDDDYGAPLVLQPQVQRRQLSAVQRLAIAAPEE